MKLRLPSISYVVARSRLDNVIGCENRLPWHLSSDLKRFKSITLNHVLIMGRKTFESIGKPLPNRISIVLSKKDTYDIRNSFWNIDGTAVIWVENKETAIFYADIITMSKNKNEFFVVGGEHIFNMFQKLFNKIHITEVIPGDNVTGDSYFDYKFDRRSWKTLLKEEVPLGPGDEYPSVYSILERKIKTVRYVDLPDYYTDSQQRQKWINSQVEVCMKKEEQLIRDRVSHYQYSFDFEAT